MADGWTCDSAVQDQIDDTVNDAVKFARSLMPLGEGLAECEKCGEVTPEERRNALPGTRTCVLCQSGRDGKIKRAGINRRRSKDS